MAAGPLTDNELTRIRDLHAAGATRNDIAKQLGRSGSTISKAAGKLGLSFDRTAVKAATEAKVADARARRARLTLDLLSDAERLRAQLWQPHEYIDHGGKDFTEARWTQPEPSPADKLKLMQAAGTAASTSMRLDLHDADTGDDGAKSMLGALAAGLQVAYEQLQPSDEAASDGGD
ncbi:helix-turn-helix domain-containing protein [Amycolatopsis taiwanensis]|uniref:helix-turn-helix domain-containing protein n=1 Tax=Amycolatopsis taiwanensis TaxID=342230 RepID=UPI00047F0DC5|nr:helix-turn-helix domain-containing protein [Amycolatopsis taiwanensis]